jgi:DNA polymerase-3 subunit alpha
MNKEKELFGFYLSYHPTTKYKDQYKVTNLNDLNKHINKVVDIIVLVEKIKVHKDKNGSDMAFITGNDEISSIELIAFSEEFEKIKDVTKGNILLVQGKVEIRNNIQMIIKKSKIIG